MPRKPVSLSSKPKDQSRRSPQEELLRPHERYAWADERREGPANPQSSKPQTLELQMKKGLYANIHAKRQRIEAGSKERMRKPGSKGAPTAAAFKASAKTAKKK